MEKNDQISDIFSSNLRRFRKEKGFTQGSLAEALGVAEHTVQNWERKRTWPKLELVLSLSNVLGISDTELFKASEPQTTQELLQIIQRQEDELNQFNSQMLADHSAEYVTSSSSINKESQLKDIFDKIRKMNQKELNQLRKKLGLG